MERFGCLKTVTIALAAGEIAAFIVGWDLVIRQLQTETTLREEAVLLAIFASLVIPVAAAAQAYLAESVRGVWIALGVVIAIPLALLSIVAIA